MLFGSIVLENEQKNICLIKYKLNRNKYLEYILTMRKCVCFDVPYGSTSNLHNLFCMNKSQFHLESTSSELQAYLFSNMLRLCVINVTFSKSCRS